MKYEKEQLVLENGIKNDWIITNGIGGYSSSTILGINTRKYHGLLVAPFQAPGGTHLLPYRPSLDDAWRLLCIPQMGGRDQAYRTPAGQLSTRHRV